MASGAVRKDRGAVTDHAGSSTGLLKTSALALAALVALSFAALRLTVARLRREALP